MCRDKINIWQVLYQKDYNLTEINIKDLQLIKSIKIEEEEKKNLMCWLPNSESISYSSGETIVVQNIFNQ